MKHMKHPIQANIFQDSYITHYKPSVDKMVGILLFKKLRFSVIGVEKGTKKSGGKRGKVVAFYRMSKNPKNSEREKGRESQYFPKIHSQFTKNRGQILMFREADNMQQRLKFLNCYKIRIQNMMFTYFFMQMIKHISFFNKNSVK